MVFQALKVLTEGTAAWSIVKTYARAKDGRGAFLGLVASYMGPSVQLLLLNKAQATLSLATYDGKSKGLTWIKHINRLRDSFADLDASGEPLSARSKVNRLVNSFQMESLKHVTTTINRDPVLQNDFEQAGAFVQGEITGLRLKNKCSNRTLSAIDTMDWEPK